MGSICPLLYCVLWFYSWVRSIFPLLPFFVLRFVILQLGGRARSCRVNLTLWSCLSTWPYSFVSFLLHATTSYLQVWCSQYNCPNCPMYINVQIAKGIFPNWKIYFWAGCPALSCYCFMQLVTQLHKFRIKNAIQLLSFNSPHFSSTSIEPRHKTTANRPGTPTQGKSDTTALNSSLNLWNLDETHEGYRW